MPPAIFQAGGPKRDTPFAVTAPLLTLPASMARLLSLNRAKSNICSDRAPVSLLDPRLRCTPDHRSRFAHGRCMRTNAVYCERPSDPCGLFMWPMQAVPFSTTIWPPTAQSKYPTRLTPRDSAIDHPCFREDSCFNSILCSEFWGCLKIVPFRPSGDLYPKSYVLKGLGLARSLTTNSDIGRCEASKNGSSGFFEGIAICHCRSCS
jgi:hypothetical protein